ncbi:MAG: hypothetical protein ACHQCF_01995 [Solirubrobacterales bacterium]
MKEELRHRHGSRARLGGVLVLALGARALLALPSFAAAKDRNHDHIPDHWEKKHQLSLRVNQAARDQDHDHLNNLGEFKAGDNPRNPDTNNDGVMDGEENAGTIASFDTETVQPADDQLDRRRNGDRIRHRRNPDPLRPRMQSRREW